MYLYPTVLTVLESPNHKSLKNNVDAGEQWGPLSGK